MNRRRPDRNNVKCLEADRIEREVLLPCLSSSPATRPSPYDIRNFKDQSSCKPENNSLFMTTIRSGTTLPGGSVCTITANPACMASPVSGMSAGNPYNDSGHFSYNANIATATGDKRTYSSVPDIERDVTKMVLELQKEVDSLRSMVDEYERGNNSGGQTYETIHPKRNVHTSGYSSPQKALSSDMYQAAMRRGLHYVGVFLDPNAGVARRLVWLLCVTACVSLLAYQLYDRVSLYRRLDVTTTTETTYPHALQFPAVTVCNLNKFRITAVVDAGLYSDISSYVSSMEPEYRKPRLTHVKPRELSCRDFLRRLGHSAKSLIHRCTWNGEECSWRNFTEVVTEYGICYTFIPDDKHKLVTKSGVGLNLLLNVEQYEYLQGPRSAVGVKVSVHDARVTPRLWLNGVNVAVGSHTSLAVEKVKRCNAAAGSSWDMWSSGASNSHLYCDRRTPCPSRHYTLCDAFATNYPGNADSQVSDCTDESDHHPGTEYHPTIYYSSLSSYAAESEVRLLAHRPDMDQHFLRAMDTYHRVNADIFAYDQKVLQRLAKGFGSTDKDIRLFLNRTKNYDSNFRQNLRNVNESFYTLLAQVSTSVAMIKKSSHIPFIHISDRILRSVKSLKQHVTKNQFSVSSDEMSDTLTKVINELKELAISRHLNRGHIYKTWLYTAIKHIENFQDEIVNGLEAQRFAEFRNARDQYSKTITRIKDLANELYMIFTLQYNALSNFTTSTPATSASYVTRGSDLLAQFENELNNIELGTVPELRENCDRLEKAYQTHRIEILDFDKELKNAIKQIDGLSAKLSRDLSSRLTVALPGLDTGLSELYIKLKNVQRDYKTGKLNKSDLARLLVSKNLWKISSDIKVELNRVEELVTEMMSTSQLFLKTAQPMFSRLVDFSIVREADVPLLVKQLELRDMKRDLENLTRFVMTTIRLIEDYRDELGEYLDNTKVDRKFYMNNFLRLDAFYPSIEETIITRRPAYGFFDFTCDIGATFALYLGASILTAFEALGFGVHIMSVVVRGNGRNDGIGSDSS